jgi:hypothetical protein
MAFRCQLSFMQSVLVRRINNEKRIKQMKRHNSDLNVLDALIRLDNVCYGACRNLHEAEFEKQNKAHLITYNSANTTQNVNIDLN